MRDFARDHGLRVAVAVRGGGHSVAGLSTVHDGMLIDLSAIRGVQVDPERRLARVQGGAVLGDVNRETQAFTRQALRAYWKSTYLDELTDDAIDTRETPCWVFHRPSS